jgi:FdhE protein
MSNPSSAAPEGMPGGIVPVRLPVIPVEIFAKRAARFRELAPGHATGDYLVALAGLADAQRVACREAGLVPSRDLVSPSVPRPAADWPRGDAWRRVLGVILSEMGEVPLPGPARAALDRLGGSASTELEACADALLAGAYDRIDPAAAPFVGAALQVYWTALASTMPAEGLGDAELGCPVCGSPPVAARVLGSDKLRYLVCSLCATEWHLTRLLCATCGAPDGVSYLAIEGDPGGVKAEACGRCRTYLKLFYLEKRPSAEPFADDAATLSLDLLMSEEGYARGGVNLFVLPGAYS